MEQIPASPPIRLKFQLKHSILLLVLAVTMSAGAGPLSAGDNQAFGKVKTLAGVWVGTEADGTPARVEYQVSSGGEALKEVLYMGTAPPMVSVFYPDKDQLAMTHYCLTRTQPRMRTVSYPPDLSELDLVYWDATNVIQSTGGVMNGVRIKFIDDDHFEQLWNADATDEASVRVTYRRLGSEGTSAATTAPLAATPPVPGGDGPFVSRAQKALARIGSLAGEWRGREATRDWDVTLRLEPISGGTAVLETMDFKEAGMMTVYHLDGDQLLMTHYCLSRSQPRMRTVSLPESLDRFDFQYLDATNVMEATESYMSSLLLQVESEDRFRQIWNQDSPGKKPIDIIYERVKPAPGKAEDRHGQ